MKLRCIKKTPVIMEELSYKKVNFNEIIDGKDETNADIIIKKYPGCFEKVPNEPIQAKIATNKKDKLLKNESQKEFT